MRFDPQALEHLDAFERSPEILRGAWRFRGTRIPVAALFEHLRDGATVAEFLDWFQGVTLAQVQEALDYEAHTLVSILPLETKLAAFAQALGARPRKQIVLVLDLVGLHTRDRLCVPSPPEHVHLLFRCYLDVTDEGAGVTCGAEVEEARGNWM